MRPKTLFRVLSFDGLHCPRCGYLLAGLDRPRCPECGEKFDAFDLWRLQREPPRPFLFPSFVALLVMPPLGLAAIHYSLECRKAMKHGDFGSAYRYSDQAVRAGLWACGLFLFFVLTLPLSLGLIGSVTSFW